MRIHSLAIKNFAPFAEGSEIVFPPKRDDSALAEVHLLVGANGSGKTRLLALICAALGNDEDLNIRVAGDSDILAAVAGQHDDKFLGVWTTEGHGVQFEEHGKARSASDWFDRPPGSPRARLSNFVSATREKGRSDSDRPFALAFDSRYTLVDCQVEPTVWKAVGEEPNLVRLSLSDGDLAAITNNFACICYRAVSEDQLERLPVKPASYSTKWRTVKRRLEDAIKQIIGAADTNFHFHYGTDKDATLRVIWGSKDMSIMQLPDGIRSVLLWLLGCISRICYLFPDHQSPLDLPFVLLLDEPETHLHPKWQRQVLLAAQALFPTAQIIAATHSPFVVASLNQGFCHIIDIGADHGGATIRKPLSLDSSDTYFDAIEDVLGLSPYERYDPDTEQKLREFDAERDAVLGGDWSREKAMLAKADEIWAANNLSARNRIGQDLATVDRARRAKKPSTKAREKTETASKPQPTRKRSAKASA